MSKINREEYEVLKDLNDKWKWIARDSECISLNVFSVKPIKTHSRWDYIDVIYKHTGLTKEESKMFQFIQWEDESPYNISELIEEYEDEEYGYFNMKLSREYEQFIEENEETEVKKNIEWFNNEVEKRINRIKTGEVSFLGGDLYGEGYIYGMREVQAIANQLDEPEQTDINVGLLKERIKTLEKYNEELIRDNNQLRSAMDNEEVLTPDWIDKHEYEEEELELDTGFHTMRYRKLIDYTELERLADHFLDADEREMW